MEIIRSFKTRLLETKIRNKDTSSSDLASALYELGMIMGTEANGTSKMSFVEIVTPMLKKFHGVQSSDRGSETLVVSTKDDFESFAKGVSEGFSSNYRAYMDFNGVRGKAIYSSPSQFIELPEVRRGIKITRVVIAKTVIASGCTAVTLAKRVITEYDPAEIIIVAPFFSERGINELNEELSNAKIFVAYGPDEINKDDMLIPGVGNLDERLRS